MNDEQFKSEIFELKKAQAKSLATGNKWFDICPIHKLVAMVDERDEITRSSEFELLLLTHCVDYCDMSDEFKTQLHNYCDEVLSRCELTKVVQKESIFQRLFS